MGIFFLVFLTVALGIAASYQLVEGYLFPGATRLKRRMTEEFAKDGNLPASSLFKDVERLSLPTGPAVTNPEITLRAMPVERGPRAGLWRGSQDRLEKLLQGAAVPVSPDQLLSIAACLALIVGGCALFLGGVWLALPAAGMAALSPLLVLRWKFRARRDKYLRQLPGAFELMARVTRAGQSVPQAFQAVAEAMDKPVAAAFADCQKQVNLGLRPELVFQELAQRSGILEMRIFTMAMLIQRQTGGNIADVLDRLAGLVRARLRLRDRVRILTAEGRMQGWTLVILPFVAFAVMMVVNRKYAEVLLEHHLLLAGMGIAMSTGILWIRSIVKAEG